MKKKDGVPKKPTRRLCHRWRYILTAIILPLLFIAVILLILLIQDSPYDKVSEATIRRAAAARLNKNPNELTDDDFAKVTELDLDGTGLSKIRFLEKFTNLQELNLSHIVISPPAMPKWKAALTRLFHIDTSTSKRILLDLGPLRNLSNLRRLVLDSTQVKNIRPLSGLTNLQKLDLTYIQVSDFEPIRGLIHLNMLCLMFTQVSDLEPIQGLEQLQTLYLNGTQVSELEPIEKLENLQWIFLDQTNVKDLEPIKELNNLKGLHLNDTQLSNLEPIKGLKNLQGLYIRNCLNITDKQVTDLKKALPNLDISQ